jgi:hypothetical protein
LIRRRMAGAHGSRIEAREGGSGRGRAVDRAVTRRREGDHPCGGHMM